MIRNNFIRLVHLSSILLLLTTIACSSSPSKRSMGEVLDDSVVTNKLKVKYIKDKEVNAFKLNVDTWKGIVSLRGIVDTQEQINQAIELAERQPGVREVKSYLILSGSAPAQTALSSKPSKSKKSGTVEEKDLTMPPKPTPENPSLEKPQEKQPIKQQAKKPKAESYDESAMEDTAAASPSGEPDKAGGLDGESSITGY